MEEVYCIKLERKAPGLKQAPFPGPLGKKIYENISQFAWEQWLKYQTLLINENRLNIADAHVRKYLREQAEKYFFGSGVDAPAGYTPQENKN